MSKHFVRAAVFLAASLCCSATGATERSQENPGTSAHPIPERSTRTQNILVFPFENDGGPARLGWLGEGLEELTAERLGGAGQHVFTREERLGELEKYGLPASTRFSRATMLRLGEDLDADCIVFGRYAFDGKILKLRAQVFRVDPPALLPAVEETGALDELMDAHTRLTWRLLAGLDSAFPLSLDEYRKRQRPLRLDALEHFSRGLLAAEDEPRIRSLREALRLEPEWTEAAYVLAQAYYGRQDCTNALAWFGRVPANHERGIEARFYSGVCALLGGEPERATVLFEDLRGRLHSPEAAGVDAPEVLNNLGVARLRLGKKQDAMAEWKKAAQLDPDDEDYARNLAVGVLETGEPATAVEALREILRRQPEDAEARALLVMALEASGRKEEAGAEREAAAAERNGKPLPALRPESLAKLERIKTHLDTAMLRQGTAEPAEAAADDAGRRGANGASRNAHVRRGRQALSAGKLDAAEREFRAVLAQSPGDAASHQGLGELYRRRGKFDEAVGELRASLAARDDAVARTSLARVYLEQRRTDLARRELQQALKLAPSYTEARQLLDKLGPSPAEGEPK